MKGLIEEISDIPKYARDCYEFYSKNEITLPQDSTLYIGMGSSYYAPLTLSFCGANIQPEMASEYYYYKFPYQQQQKQSQSSQLEKSKSSIGVLISQSGASSETVWTLECFDSIVAITNEEKSPIGSSPKTKNVHIMKSGIEKCSSTKTYMNTLIILYMGFKINPEPGIVLIEKNLEKFKSECQALSTMIFAYMKKHVVKGRIIIGSGPNIGTAHQASLTFSETTRELWSSMTIAQFDHGPKECSDNNILILLNGKGKDANRINQVKTLILKNQNENTNAPLVIELIEDQVSENLSPIPFNLKLNLIMNYLGDLMLNGEEFSYKIGGKVTLVDTK